MESAEALAELRRLETAGRLQMSIPDLALSYVHMHVNRMIRSAARAHELVIYDLLGRLHESQAARARGGGRPASAPGAPETLAS